jgi:hypothetical protein
MTVFRASDRLQSNPIGVCVCPVLAISGATWHPRQDKLQQPSLLSLGLHLLIIGKIGLQLYLLVRSRPSEYRQLLVRILVVGIPICHLRILFPLEVVSFTPLGVIVVERLRAMVKSLFRADSPRLLLEQRRRSRHESEKEQGSDH